MRRSWDRECEGSRVDGGKSRQWKRLLYLGKVCLASSALPEVTYSSNNFPTSGAFITAGLRGSGMMLQKGLAASGKHFSLTWKQTKAWISTTLLTSGSSITCSWTTLIEMLLHGQMLGTTINSRSGENHRKLRMTCFF